MSNLCFICGNNLNELKNVLEYDENNLSILIKLQKCVPEVKWKNEYKICLECEKQLENVYNFRELCIKSYLNEENQIKAAAATTNLLEINENNVVVCCYHCEKTFATKTILESHIKKHHHPTIKYKCESCNKCFSSKTNLIKHESICTNNEIIINENLTQTNNNNNNNNVCDICGTIFTTKYLRNRHMKNVHATEKKFKCDLCDRKFASAVYLSAHKRYHIGERKHICSFCGKGYITASDLYHHEKIHANKRAYRCEICPKGFNTSSDLHKHKICVHLDRSQWKYECSYCQRKFPLKTNLDTHTKIHTGEKNFLCHLCDRKCINKSVLKRHIDSHSIEKSFKCELCLQTYKYQKNLDIHMVKVHGIGDTKIPERVKRFFCNQCPKSYFANNKLQKHIRSHTGERPFPCPACDKCFTDKSYIKQHLKSAHNVV